MKRLLDEGLPQRAATRLREDNLDASHVLELELELAGRSDEQILEHAARTNHIVVTLDSDFHRILASSHAVRPSVIRLRVEGLKDRAAAQLIRRVVDRSREVLEQGAVVSANRWQVRIRTLPLDSR